MKKILLIISVLISFVASSQSITTPRHVYINNKYIWEGGTFRQLNIPIGPTPVLRTDQSGEAGALFVDTTGGNKGLHGYWDGAWHRFVDTTMAYAQSANNGITISSNFAQLGSSTLGGAASIPFTTDRWLYTGLNNGNKLTMYSDVSGVFPSYPYTYTEFSYPTVMKFKGIDGGAIKFVVLDSAASTTDSYPGLNWYTGNLETLQWQLGMHYQAADKHAFIDLKSTGGMTHFGVEYNGVGLANFHTNGLNYIGFSVGAKRTRFGGTSPPGQTVSITGSLSVSDSAMFAKKMFITDSTGYDIMLSQRASPYVTKLMTIADLSSFIAGGSGWGLTGNTVGANGKYIGTNDNYNFAIKANGIQKMLVSGTGSMIIGDTYAAGPITKLHVKVDGSQSYGAKGLEIEDIFNGGTVVLAPLAGTNDLYISNAAGAAGGLSIGNITNPSDGSTLSNASGYWKFNSTSLGIGTTPTHSLTVNGQVRINAINSASTYDSAIVINAGVLEKTAAIRTLSSQYTDVGNVGSGEDDLMTYTVPAGILANDGDYIEFTMALTTSSANNKTITIWWGAAGSEVFNSTSNAIINVTGRITRKTATTQIFSLTSETGSAALSASDLVASSETLSGTVVLKATGEATNTNEILMRQMTVKYFPAN